VGRVVERGKDAVHGGADFIDPRAVGGGIDRDDAESGGRGDHFAEGGVFEGFGAGHEFRDGSLSACGCLQEQQKRKGHHGFGQDSAGHAGLCPVRARGTNPIFSRVARVAHLRKEQKRKKWRRSREEELIAPGGRDPPCPIAPGRRDG